MTIRVIQWGAGVNGSSIIRGVARHDELELVGCRVYSDEKHGVDAGTLAGIDPIGVFATNVREEIMALDERDQNDLLSEREVEVRYRRPIRDEILKKQKLFRLHVCTTDCSGLSAAGGDSGGAGGRGAGWV